MGKINNIFFDLDRTLWDFEKNSSLALQIIFEELHLEKYIDGFDNFLAT